MFLLISCFTVILLPFCVTKLIEFYTLPHPSLGRYLAECDPALEGYTLPLLSCTEASLCHGKWRRKKESARGTKGRGKRRRGVSSLQFLLLLFFTGIANRSPFGEERGILLIVASTGIRHLVPGVFHKEYQYSPSYNELSRKWRTFSMQCLKCQQRLNF